MSCAVKISSKIKIKQIIALKLALYSGLDEKFFNFDFSSFLLMHLSYICEKENKSKNPISYEVSFF